MSIQSIPSCHVRGSRFEISSLKSEISNLKSRVPRLKFLLLVLLSVPALAAAPAAPAPAPTPPIEEITAAQRAAIEKGLAWLAAQQRPDGSYSQPAVTALAGVAFMSAGNLPNRGQYGANVQKCVDAVLANCQESGLIAQGQTGGPPMYGHGFNTLFLGEVFGMTQNEDVRERLTKAVRLIEATQSQEGGWRYQPAPNDADISVTICQVMGLRAARDAGIKVNKDVIDKAIKYVRRCQNADGGFSYQAGQGSDSGFARTAAGVATLFYAGAPTDGNDIERGLKFLGNPAQARDDSYFYYGNYYAAQAAFLAGGEFWKKYYPDIRAKLLTRQANNRNGSWPAGEAAEDYATSMALIILQLPNRYLPVFHGKGAGG
jgi:hypothetical protein